MEQLPVIVLGAGGHAKVIIDTLHQLDRQILGLTVRNAVLTGTQILGEKVLGTDVIVADHAAKSIQLANAVASVTTPNTRVELYERFVDQGYEFITLVHPRAYVSPSVTLGPGSQIFAGAVVQSGTAIGMNVIINTSVTIDHDCHISRHVLISPGAILCGAVTIGRYATIGAGAIIREGLSIGENSVVGAGAVVLKDVPPNTRVAGDPARRI